MEPQEPPLELPLLWQGLTFKTCSKSTVKELFFVLRVIRQLLGRSVGFLALRQTLNVPVATVILELGFLVNKISLDLIATSGCHDQLNNVEKVLI